MNSAPRASRMNITLLGRRNVGKSSLINVLTGQRSALVSPVPGTTTDPVYKAMEIAPLGPVMLIDTAGIDDHGELGRLRSQRSKRILKHTDLVLLVVDATVAFSDWEEEIVRLCRENDSPFLVVLNKGDLVANQPAVLEQLPVEIRQKAVLVSATKGKGVDKLIQAIIDASPKDWDNTPIVADLVGFGETVIMVVPIDSASPKNRLILPQVQTIRDVLDGEACVLVCKPQYLARTLDKLNSKPKLVITDSQAFSSVQAQVPADVMLTSFSILFARKKGDLGIFVQGAQAIGKLQPGDEVLVAETCTHNTTHEDIGRVKIPNLLHAAVGGELKFQWARGMTYPHDLERYKLVIHCGGCMVNRREMLARMARARELDIPIVNYGIALAFLQGILPRVLSPFPEVLEAYKQGDEAQ